MGLCKRFYFQKAIFGLLAVWLIVATGPALAQQISILPDTQLDKCGDQDTIWIYADAGVVDVKAMEFKIGFDSTYATAGTVFKGTGLDSDDQLFFDIDNPNDSLLINIAILGTGDIFSGADTIAGITFIAENEIASTALTFTRSALRDSLNQSISHTTDGATLEIDCTPPAVPALISPADGSFMSNVTPELNWNPANDAVSYTLEYADNSGFSGAIQVTGLVDTNYTMPTLAQGTWYWHVKAVDLALNESAYSSDWSFTIDTDAPPVPVLVFPANGGFVGDNTPTLTWRLSTGANEYTLEYADNPGFTGATQVTGITDTTYTAPVLADGVWYWHVKAIDQALNESAYSSAWSFTVDTDSPDVPVLISPSNGAYTNDNTPEFNWNPAPGAATYTLEYADNSGFTGSILVTGLADTNYTTPLLTDGTWYWHVKAVDEALNESAYSPARSFIVDTSAPLPPSNFTASPGNNSIDLSWTNATGGFHHTVIMRSDWYAGGHDYPEYDNPEGPYPSDTTAFDLVYSGTGITTSDINDLSNATRDIYHYAAFTVDSAGNMSVPSVGAAATSYWLGDVAGAGGLNDYDGQVYFQDLLVLSNCYWTSDGDANYRPQFDIGPTSNGSPFGLPTTDNTINFEDLVIFAINFNTVAPMGRSVPLLNELEKTGPLGLSMRVTDNLEVGEEFTVSVRLNNNPDAVKGINFTIPYDHSRIEFVGAAQSQELNGSGCPIFFDGREAGNVVDVSLALLGGNSAIGGSGEIAQLTFRLLDEGDLSLAFGSVELRDGQNIALPAANRGWDYRTSPELPSSYGLSQNYPNPFNMQARISFQLPEPGFVTLKIYNIRGQLVRTLVSEYKPAGYHSEVWDGRNDSGNEISSGVYTYRMESNKFSASRKMVLLK